MNTLKKALGIVFAILFIFTATPALILFNFDCMAFTAETYQKAFAHANFYNKLPADMAKAMIFWTAEGSQFPIVIRSVSQDAWEGYFRAILPQEILKAMGDEILTSTFAYINMQADSIQISLVPLKAGMVSDAGVQAVYMLLNTQPDCTLEQIAQTTINLLTNGEIEFCNPPAEIAPILTPIIQGQMQTVSQILPSHLTLISAPTQNDPREKLQTARMSMRLSPVLPLFLLLFMTLFTVTSFKSWLTWWGIPLFVTGICSSLIGIGGARLFGAILKSILVNMMPAFLPPILLDYAGNLASVMVQALLRPILWQGLVITMLGLIMVTGSRINFYARK
jgi:hypothetical protein